jgi:hypothetical protein
MDERVARVSPGLDAGGMRVFWKGGTGVWQYLERREELGLTSDYWTVIFSNMPPRGTATNRLDLQGTDNTLFYRIRTQR